MAMERQNTWGTLAALDMFLGGAGAGAFAVGFILNMLDDMKLLALAGTLAGPLLVIAGTVMLLIEAGSPLKAYRLLTGLSTSWMSRGGLIHALFIIFGLAYAVPGIWQSAWVDSAAGAVLGAVAFVLALVTAAYHGMIMSQARGIPLWSSSVTPVLSFITALSTGSGFLLAVAPAFFSAYEAAAVESAMTALAIVGMCMATGGLITLWYLAVQQPNATYVASVRRIRIAIMVDVACLLLAILLLAYGLTLGEEASLIWMAPVSGVALLAAGFLIRYSIVKAGYYTPLRVFI
jgi:formate-dependent nitrite reductase membrane component NrfD